MKMYKKYFRRIRERKKKWEKERERNRFPPISFQEVSSFLAAGRYSTARAEIKFRISLGNWHFPPVLFFACLFPFPLHLQEFAFSSVSLWWNLTAPSRNKKITDARITRDLGIRRWNGMVDRRISEFVRRCYVDAFCAHLKWNQRHDLMNFTTMIF